MSECRATWARVIALAFVGVLLMAGCGASDSGIQDDGLTIQNPHDGLWQDRDEVPIRFELEQTFGAEEEPEEAILGGIQSVVADDAGNVYLYDSGAARIVSFDASGKLRWATGRAGQGPGEFQQVSGMAWDGGENLFVLNQFGERLEKFDLKGMHLGSMPVDLDGLRFPTLVGLIGPDLFVFACPMMGRFGNVVVVARYREDWEEVARIQEDQSGNLPKDIPVVGGSSVSLVGSRISSGNLGEYRLAFYDSTGTLVRDVRRDMHDLVRPGVYPQGGGVSMSNFGGLQAPVALASGHILVAATWPTNVDDPDEVVRMRAVSGDPYEVDFAYSLDLYDAAGRLLYTMRTDSLGLDLGYIASSDNRGRVYSIYEEPYPHLRRYRVVIDE